MDVRFGILTSLLVGLTIGSGGCGTGGAVSRMRGQLATEEPYGIEQTYDAARRAMDVLGLKIIEEETGADALSAHVTARDSSDAKMFIRIKSITANTTRVLVQVGAFGDESKTRRIQDTIRECLQAPEPQEPASGGEYMLPLPIPVPVEMTQAAPESAESEQPALSPEELPDPAADGSTPPTP